MSKHGTVYHGQTWELVPMVVLEELGIPDGAKVSARELELCQELRIYALLARRKLLDMTGQTVPAEEELEQTLRTFKIGPPKPQ